VRAVDIFHVTMYLLRFLTSPPYSNQREWGRRRGVGGRAGGQDSGDREINRGGSWGGVGTTKQQSFFFLFPK
jgi:hypothetical protein